ncbi:MAG: GNAT family N-acetyltransferase [Myxococcales bacterium]|nr:GNAT family N-acetyltransferase [Myxococcales bacterium]
MGWTAWADHIAYRADSPLAGFHHRLLLREPPGDLQPWLDRWRALNAHNDIQRAFVVWEGDRPEPVDLPPGARLHTQWCLELEGRPASAPDPRIRRLHAPDRFALAPLYADSEAPDDLAWAHWALEGVLERDDAAYHGLFEGGRLVAAAGVCWDDRDARFHMVATAPEHRRRGFATRLVLAAVNGLPDGRRVWIAAEADGAAEVLYCRLGFRRRTAVTVVAVPRGTR